ncbi:hypothetical protein D3C71_1401420 [compost metagenome]
MFCEECIKKAIEKLRAEDIIILEYLHGRGAVVSQCSISRSIVRDENNLSDYKCYTALERLELFDFVNQQSKSKSNKYFITSKGKEALVIAEKKLGEVG